jgi:hypothetical protein
VLRNSSKYNTIESQKNGVKFDSRALRDVNAGMSTRMHAVVLTHVLTHAFIHTAFKEQQQIYDTVQQTIVDEVIGATLLFTFSSFSTCRLFRASIYLFVLLISHLHDM